MKYLKRFSGIVWMVFAFLAVYLLLRQASTEFAASPALDTRIFWYTIIPVFIPIMAGLGLFGYYCLKGEYDESLF
jgi:hypothetical protein